MSTSLPGFPRGRGALLIAHPGHELRIHGWIERARPIVFALTDGSGHGDASRAASSLRVLERAGARTAAVFGRFTDAELYGAMLERRSDVFTGVADEIAACLTAEQVTHLVADAAEGYNPSHDLCRYVADAAAALADLSDDLGNLEFDLVAAPGASGDTTLHFDLDDEALARKLAAASAYPEMAGEVASAIGQWGREAFRRESFRPVSRRLTWADRFEGAPYYERHGEQRRADGTYGRVIRYAEHVRPLRDALQRHATAARA